MTVIVKLTNKTCQHAIANLIWLVTYDAWIWILDTEKRGMETHLSFREQRNRKDHWASLQDG